MLVVSWSPDAQLIASGDMDGNILLWDPKDGKLLGSCSGHKKWITSMVSQPARGERLRDLILLTPGITPAPFINSKLIAHLLILPGHPAPSRPLSNLPQLTTTIILMMTTPPSPPKAWEPAHKALIPLSPCLTEPTPTLHPPTTPQPPPLRPGSPPTRPCPAGGL